MEIDPVPPPDAPPEPAATGPEPARGWTFADVIVVACFAVGVQLVLLVLGAVVLLGLGRVSAKPNAFIVLPVQIIWWVAVFWIIYRVVRARDPRPFREAVGWVRPHLPIGMFFGGGALLALSVAAFYRLLPPVKKHTPMEELFRDPRSALLLAVFGVLVAPAIEELLFRGFLYPVIARAYGAAAAAVSTGALFSLVHAPQYGWAWQNIVLLTYVGVVFGAIRAWSGSLIPSTLVHASYNLTLFAGLFAATRGFRNFSF